MVQSSGTRKYGCRPPLGVRTVRASGQSGAGHDRRHRPGAVAVAGLGAENHRGRRGDQHGVATSLATLAAFVYNATARFVGGSELTLSEGD